MGPPVYGRDRPSPTVSAISRDFVPASHTWAWGYGIAPVLVRCSPEVDTVLANRHRPEVSFLTACLATSDGDTALLAYELTRRTSVKLLKLPEFAELTIEERSFLQATFGVSDARWAAMVSQVECADGAVHERGVPGERELRGEEQFPPGLATIANAL